MDKKILPEGNLSFLPPRLVEAQQGWYFVFYQLHPEIGDLERHRISYNLGRIKLKKDKRARAKELQEVLGELMRKGYPWVNGKLVYEIPKFIAQLKYVAPNAETLKGEENLAEVVLHVADLYSAGLKEDTVRTYVNRAKIFSKRLKETGRGEWTVTQFRPEHAQEYMDGVRLQVNNNTYNNYRRELVRLINA
ncbi:MAG: hypothetical protein Q7T20_10030, partial [Saprospiraceae bacterium]|nr:hypothetical protein [Saprospiraceae bacterium]